MNQPIDLVEAREKLSKCQYAPDYAAWAAFRGVKLLDELESARAEIAALRLLVVDLTDADPCKYDHNGCCQAHSLHVRPCPHEVAKSLTGASGRSGE